MRITVVGISYDSPKGLKAFQQRYSLPFIFLSDKDKSVSKSYGSSGLIFPKRKTFVINEKGVVTKIYNKVNVNTHAEEILNDLNAGK